MKFLKIEPPQNRVYGLDILRALAIIFVVYEHGIYIFSNDMTKRIMEVLVLDGVSIFFVLSGFLIGGILIKTIETKESATSMLVDFWKRRWFRTLPNYFLILIITFVAFGNVGALDFTKYFLFIQNFSTPHPSFFPEAWSLSIEEWFYLLMPIWVFLAIKSGIQPKRSVLLSIIAIIVMSICMRYYKFYTIEIKTLHAWDMNFRKQVVTRLDSIMFGVLGAYLNYYYNDIWLRYKKSLLFVGASLLLLHKITFLIRGHFNLKLVYYCVYSFSLSPLGTLLLLPFLSAYEKRGGRAYKIITVISLISYSMYLINLTLVQHYFIPLLMNLAPVPLTGILLEIYKYIIYWAITIVGSILIYKYYETPFTRLRDVSIFSKLYK